MIFEWLGVKSLFGLARGWLLLALVLAVVSLIIWAGAAEKADDQRNQDIGAAVQREGDLRETLQRTEEANAARSEIGDDRGTARFDQCLRTARTPENCQRFLPGGGADQR
jgi:hypothetical protein